MKKPRPAPVPDDWLSAWKKDPDRMIRAMQAVAGPSHQGKYLHWDELRYRNAPSHLTHLEWWAALKSHRAGLLGALPILDARGKPFMLGMPDKAWETVHFIDKNASGALAMPDVVTSRQERDRYIVRSLAEEAIRSSQIEGAATTRKVAVEMLRTGRKPRGRDELMISNNFRTMQHILELGNQKLDMGILLELQRMLTIDTLDDPGAAGRLRRKDERVLVLGAQDEVLHVPPKAAELQKRLEGMFEFFNAQAGGDRFVHPVVKAIVAHFALAYIHPFVDGNGRCARALFYWSMLRSGYWLCEYVSISRVIHAAPAKYARAFLFTETDGNDVTYFVMFHLEVLRRAIEELYADLERKVAEARDIESQLDTSQDFNHRQIALLAHAVRNPGFVYTVRSHMNSHGIVYETARTDLHALASRGLLVERRSGRTWRFQAPQDIAERLDSKRRKNF